jgi:hypothetical protein
MFFQTLFHLSKLHILQFSRLLREIGPARIVILIIVMAIFINQFAPLINFQSPWIGLVVLPMIFAFAGMKGENSFFRILDMPVFVLRFTRNLVFASPGITLLLFYRSLTGLLVAISIIIFISLIPSTGTLQLQLPEISVKTRLLPWTVGLRKSLFWIVLSVTLCIAGIFHIAFSFAAIFTVHFLVLGFFNNNEPPHLIESYGMDANSFLRFYTIRHLSYFAIPFFIFSAFGSMFHKSTVPVFIVVGLLLLLHQWLTVNLKFAFYEPGKSNESMQSIQTLMLAFLLIPFTIPIPLWYLSKYRKKAVENLRIYI